MSDHPFATISVDVDPVDTRLIGYGDRSPNFDMDRTALRVLAECGYRYDVSAYPTPLLFPARLLLALKSGDPGAALRYSLTDARFESAFEGFARRGEPVSYLLHAVDVLGLREDRLDPRLAGHPGMDRSLAAKLELLERSLRSIVQRFAIETFEERLPA